MTAKNQISKEIREECRRRLIKKRAEVLNQFLVYKADFQERESGGDEADQTQSLLNENRLHLQQQRLRNLMFEIEQALGRIEAGNYGICEETQELIEPERLLALPWTRVSLEGAEIREATASRGFSR